MTKQEIFDMIRAESPLDPYANEEIAQDLSAFGQASLLEDLHRFYEEWLVQQKACDAGKSPWEKVEQATSLFELTCYALALQGDAAIIQYLLQYLPPDENGPEVDPLFREDYNEEFLNNCITSTKYYGAAYIPALLSCIHQLVPDKLESAELFFYTMVLDCYGKDAKFAQENPLVANLHRVDPSKFKQILDFSVKRTQEELEEHQAEHNERGIQSCERALGRIGLVMKEFHKIFPNV